MRREEAIEMLKKDKEQRGNCFISDALDMAIKALEKESALDKIRAEIEMYEADCKLQGGTDECEECNSNVFGSIYRIIDKYKAESEDKK